MSDNEPPASPVTSLQQYSNSTPLITFLNHYLHFLPSVHFTSFLMRHSQAHQMVSLMFGSGQLGDMSEREDVCKRERARQKETLQRVHYQWPPLTDWDAASLRPGGPAHSPPSFPAPRCHTHDPTTTTSTTVSPNALLHQGTRKRYSFP